LARPIGVVKVIIKTKVEQDQWTFIHSSRLEKYKKATFCKKLYSVNKARITANNKVKKSIKDLWVMREAKT